MNKFSLIVFLNMLLGCVFVNAQQWSNSAGNYTSGNLGIGTSSVTAVAQLEVAGSGTAVFHNAIFNNPSGYGYIDGAVNIFRNNPNASTVNTVLNLANYWNSLSQNTSVLAIDFRSGDGTGASGGNPTGRIKVQTAWETPFMDFDLMGSTVMRLQSGKVGIGTIIPSTQLEVVGAGGNNGINIRNPAEVAGWGLALRQKDDLSGSIVCSGRNLQIEPGWTNSLILGSTQMEANGGKTVFPGGYVGIGTTNPTQRLTVKGTVYSTEVKVDLAAGSGPDYVFEPTYTLPSLDSVQSYINQNKHLPGVPSAKEMETNGVNLGEMNMLLLKKVEELTLYQIESNKRVERLQQQIDDLKKLKK